MITTLNQALYTVAWTLAQATKDALDGEVEACHNRLDEIVRDIEHYRSSLRLNTPVKGYEYQSEGERPAGWMTVVEYLYANDPTYFDYCDDIAAETSAFGVKAKRMMINEGMGSPRKVKAPPCLAEDRHIVDVNCYPTEVLARCRY